MTRHWIALLRPAKKEATSRASENFWKISALQPSWNFQPPGLRKWWFLIGHLLGVWTARVRSTNNHHDRRDPKNTLSIHPSVDTQVAPLFEKNIAEESISSSSLQTRRCNCLVWINHEHYMMTWWPNSSEGGPYWPSGAVGKWVPWVPPIPTECHHSLSHCTHMSHCNNICGWSVDPPRFGHRFLLVNLCTCPPWFPGYPQGFYWDLSGRPRHITQIISSLEEWPRDLKPVSGPKEGEKWREFLPHLNVFINGLV